LNELLYVFQIFLPIIKPVLPVSFLSTKDMPACAIQSFISDWIGPCFYGNLLGGFIFIPQCREYAQFKGGKKNPALLKCPGQCMDTLK
jgi:hypothetical protein